jgi:biopolymer transport protein TolR
MAVGGGKGVNSTPNVVPMIDVMLVLLIIFMVVTPALLAGFNAVPPAGVNIKDHPEEPENQVVGIDKDGVYYLNKKPIRFEDIGPALKQIFETREEDKILYIKADKDLPYAKVIDVMDLAAKNGVRMTAMISEQTPGTTSSVEGDIKAATP